MLDRIILGAAIAAAFFSFVSFEVAEHVSIITNVLNSISM
jgi:hypothetical protein